jgi:hypothetical protein
VWVYQEVVVSRNAVLRCGGDQTDWEALSSFVTYRSRSYP